MPNNKLIVAAAGSGKTTTLVNEALEVNNGRVLITTYTNANEAEIRHKLREEKHSKAFIPGNIIVQTWFEFLLQHGVKPYRNYIFPKIIKGFNLVKGRSARGIPEKDTERHFFDQGHWIYSDKACKFAIRCNEESQGKVIDRLSQIYQYIFVDEAQDMAAYDLDFLKILFESKINVIVVCDPRQGVYSTNNASKHSKYKRASMLSFFEEKVKDYSRVSLTINHRSIAAVCEFSDRLFPQFPQTTSDNSGITGHDGIFMVRSKDVAHYLESFKPMQLRYSRKTAVSNEHAVMNFGDCKGLSFDRVLIYPTADMKKWLKNNKTPLKNKTRSRMYVAITRARYSVAIVYDHKATEIIDGTSNYNPPVIIGSSSEPSARQSPPMQLTLL